MATPVYLGVWNSLTPISNEEAARQYRLLCDMEATARRFDAEVYAFYSRLISLYREVVPFRKMNWMTVPGLAAWKCRTVT